MRIDIFTWADGTLENPKEEGLHVVQYKEFIRFGHKTVLSYYNKEHFLIEGYIFKPEDVLWLKQITLWEYILRRLNLYKNG